MFVMESETTHHTQKKMTCCKYYCFCFNVLARYDWDSCSKYFNLISSATVSQFELENEITRRDWGPRLSFVCHHKKRCQRAHLSLSSIVPFFFARKLVAIVSFDAEKNESKYTAMKTGT